MNVKSRELGLVSERVGEGERRVKGLLEECRRKDERNKEVNLELI